MLARALSRGVAPARAVLLALPLLAAAGATADTPAIEPSLIEAQDAAVRQAGGPRESDASRLSRARAAHWAPVVRGLVGGRGDERTRDGELRRDPLHWVDRGQALTWGLTATWDLPQAIYARDETQLVHAQIHLEKVRQAAAREAVRLFLERRDRKRALPQAAQPDARLRLQQDVVRLTASLDALTGGLFREPLLREVAELSRAEPVLAPPQAPLRAPPPLQVPPPSNPDLAAPPAAPRLKETR